MDYPGIDRIEKYRAFFRSVGSKETGNQLGFGYIHKSGVTIDEQNTLFPYYSCCYVIRGKGLYIDKLGKKYPISAGSIFQRFPGQKHSTIIDPESGWAECFLDFGVEIYHHFLTNMHLVDPERPVIKTEKNLPIDRQIWDYMMKLENSEESLLPDLLLDSLSYLRNILTERDHPRKWIEQSCRDFSRDYNKRIDLQNYCRDKGIGYETFRKQFKRFTGLSPVKYLIRKRMDMACHLLLMTEKSIGIIADELGYKSQYEFSSQFRDLIGLSPREYRMKKSY